MEHKTITTIEKLTVGDRFYIASDKKKKVLQKVISKVKSTNYYTYSHFAIEAAILDQGNRYHQSYIDSQKKTFKSHTQVVFLRHSNPI